MNATIMKKEYMNPDRNPYIQMGTVQIQPGEYQTVTFLVGKLPIGQKVGIKIHIFHSPNPGPRILLLAGVHGDEINGVFALKNILENGMLHQLKRGSVIVVPLLNVYSFLNFSRDLPDGKDVNRSFPGNARGSLASRMASVVTKRILPEIDFGIDFHTGSSLRYNYPQIRYTKADSKSKELADIFNAPVQFPMATISNSLRKTARIMNKPIVVFEGGESMRLDEYSNKIAATGINNVLSHFEMIHTETKKSEHLDFGHTAWIRATSAGIFTSYRSSGEHVTKSEVIGSISDPFGEQISSVVASKDGFLIGHNQAAVVNHGDALYHLAFNK
jgi:predicted deacylase